MSYFVRNYGHLSFPVGDDNQIGFRASQVAALNALNAHFFGRTEPAIVVMPTGSGKSAVLTAAPFILRASRVLVLTPSRLVREQLAENFASLVDLRKLEAMSREAIACDLYGCTVRYV
jgi:superfamily II DNA or RNA helicase